MLAARTSTVAEIGRVTNTIHDPSAAASARLRCCSAIGPRIAPITAGASGICQHRIKYPAPPTTYSSPTSKIERLTLYAPTLARTSIPA